MGTRAADGTLFIKGRYKTMILSASGQNIYPEEIEAKLNNMPYVNESLIVERGKGLTALVYPDYEQMDADSVDMGRLRELMEHNRTDLNSLVAPYEKSTISNSFPTNSRKPQRNQSNVICIRRHQKQEARSKKENKRQETKHCLHPSYFLRLTSSNPYFDPKRLSKGSDSLQHHTIQMMLPTKGMKLMKYQPPPLPMSCIRRQLTAKLGNNNARAIR